MNDWWDGVPEEDRPGGYRSWSWGQVDRFLDARKRRLIKQKMWRERILFLAKTEVWRPRPIQVLEGTPAVDIEATYGPLAGTPMSSITVLGRGEERDFTDVGTSDMRDIPNGVTYPPQIFIGREHIGPKTFLTKLFQVIGYFGGRAKVKMKPSGLVFETDPVLFLQWAEKPEEMVQMLSGTLKITDKSA
jgi:hypothetical protein